MKRKFYSVLAIIILSVFLLFCGGEDGDTETDESKMTVIMITDQAGLGDQGFNDSGWAGVKRAVEEFHLNASFVESNEQADYIPNITIAAQKADIIITMGYLMIDATKDVAPRYPNKHFIFIDGKVEAPNVASFDFKGEEASFLSGVIAADVSRSGKIGIINGMDIPPVLAYEYGFRSGIKAAGYLYDRNFDIHRNTIGSFNDPVKGKSLARNLLNQGCDVILQIAGNSGIGVIELFKQLEKPGFLISSDINIEEEIPGRVLTCVMKRFDVAVYNAIREAVQKKFKPGYFNIGLEDGAVGITEMKYTKKFVDPETLNALDKLKSLIIDGKLIVPATKEDFENFRYEALAQENIKF